MSVRAAAVPRWVRIVMFILAVMNLAFAVMGYWSNSLLFPEVAGSVLAPDSAILTHASLEFSARNLAIGIAVLIVSRVGVPEAIAIVAIIRALTELQTIIIGLATGLSASTVVPDLVLPIALLVVEVVIVRAMFGLVAKLEAGESRPR